MSTKVTEQQIKPVCGNADLMPNILGIQRCSKEASYNRQTEKTTHAVNHPAPCVSLCFQALALSPLPFGNAQISSLWLAGLTAQLALSSCSSLLKTPLLHLNPKNCICTIHAFSTGYPCSATVQKHTVKIKLSLKLLCRCTPEAALLAQCKRGKSENQLYKYILKIS